MKHPQTALGAPRRLLICRTAVCSGQIAQTEAPPPETPPGKPTVKRGFRTVRRAVILSILVILLILWVAAKPLEAWWIGRSTATSWPLWSFRLPGTSVKPSVSVYTSITLPEDRSPAIGESFTITVGVGQAASHEEATLYIDAPGFDITDSQGITLSDQYARSIRDFAHERYDMVYRRRGDTIPIACGYTEVFTLCYRGDTADTAQTYGISAGVQTVWTDSSGTEGDAASIFYTLRDNHLRLTTKKPGSGYSPSGVELTTVADQP